MADVQHQTRATPAPLLGTLVMLALGAFLPIWIISSTGNATKPDPAWVGTLLIAVIAGVRFAWLMAARERRLFEMATWLFFYVFLGLAPTVQLREQVDPSTTPGIAHELAWTAVGVVLAAEIGLLVGSAFRRQSSVNSMRRGRTVDQTRTFWVSILMVVAAMAYIAVVGLPTLWSSRIVRDRASTGVVSDPLIQLVIGGFVSVGLLVVVVAQIQNWRDRGRDGQKRTVFLIALSVIPLLNIVNVIGSPRYVFGVIVLGLAAAFGAYSTLRRYRITSLLAIGAIVVVFPVLDAFRYDSTSGVEGVDPIVAFQSGDFDAFAQVVNTVEYVQSQGLTAGWQMLGVALFWVPRSFWPGKPIDTGTLLAEWKGYDFGNLSAPLPAELYINGGWLLLVTASVALGWFMRGWDAQSNFEAERTGAPTVLGCVLPFYMILLLRGSLLQAMASLAVILIVWLLVSKRRATVTKCLARSRESELVSPRR